MVEKQVVVGVCRNRRSHTNHLERGANNIREQEHIIYISRLDWVDALFFFLATSFNYAIDSIKKGPQF